MATIKSFPNNQDTYIGAEDVMKWLHGRTSGVFASGENATVSALVDSAMAVTVSDGNGWMSNAKADGIVWWNDHESANGTKLQLSIDPADGVLNRIDRIIVEWKTTNYVDYPEIKVLKGNSASDAVAPALTNNSTVRQISLAKVSVSAGTTAITASMITDERLDASVCGLVTESITLDTTTMQKQFAELLETIQNELQDINGGNAFLLRAGGTMYGVLDMGGNKISNVPTPESETDAANKKYVDDAIKIVDLLWENASLSSAFDAQDIAMDLSEYKGIFVDYIASPSATSYVASGLIPITDTNYFSFYMTTSGSIRRRACKASSSKVSFEKGISGSNDSTTVMIPIRIYGVK